MPHFKCVPCKTRLHSAAGPADLVGDLCPSCGALLEPVKELAEIVGFGSIRSRDGAADDSPPRPRERIADRVDDHYALREAIRAEALLDAGRWDDDGGSFSREAVAEAIALPTPGEKP